MSQSDISPEDFSGIARLFPLPNLVMYPQVMQPLHIFEPRYREMTKDALEDDRLIALTLLKPDWEKDYLDRPAIHQHACVCQIMAEQKLDDGRYNMLVRGVWRAEIASELDCATLYRQAEVNLLEDVAPTDPSMKATLKKLLVEEIPAWFPNQPQVLSQFKKLLENDISLGTYCDIVTFALPLPVEFKQELLAEQVVEVRANRLLQQLRARKSKTFPPDFSAN